MVTDIPIVAIATLLTLFCSLVVSEIDHPELFTNTYAVHIHGGEEHANNLAKRHGFINLGLILPDHYHFWDHRNSIKRTLRETTERHVLLRKEPEVKWIEQQKVKRRTKRDFNVLPAIDPDENLGPTIKTNTYNPHLNDAYWSKLWYLKRGNGIDMNVFPAWQMGYTGKGVVVSILDDGIERTNPDLMNNYDREASYDVNGNDPDPQPRYDYSNENRHGTRCAGEVAAEANNTICSVGVAFRAGIGGVRMLDGDVTDAVESRSLSHNPHHVDIYSASWGPDDDGKTVDGPGKMAKMSFLQGVKTGRRGLGSIFVWASGNGGRSGDSCGCDGYTNSIYTISVSSVSERGSVPWYSERCASTLTTTYSSGESGEKEVVTTDLHNGCTDRHSGTSASAPLAAGLCALALEANPNLSWRDLQHIIVVTSRPQHLTVDDWVVNGAGYHVSHSFGFGLMDAGAMVDVAKDWRRVPDQHICTASVLSSSKMIPASGSLQVISKSIGCKGTGNVVQSLEHVVAKLSIDYTRRGDLQISLISPSGTKSLLLPQRNRDYSSTGFRDWEFLTTHCWGETPQGTWTLEITNKGASRNIGKLVKWDLILYGTEIHPLQKHSGVRKCSDSEYMDMHITENGTIHHSCMSCYASCKSCSGPGQGQCISCQFNYQKRDLYCVQNIAALGTGAQHILIAVCVSVVFLIVFLTLLTFFMWKSNFSGYHVKTLEYSKLLNEDGDLSDEENGHFSTNDFHDEITKESHVSTIPETTKTIMPSPPPIVNTENNMEALTVASHA